MADISHHCCSNTLHGMHHQLILYVQMAHPAPLINTNIVCFLYNLPVCRLPGVQINLLCNQPFHTMADRCHATLRF